jgi:cytochrome c5
MNMLRNWLLFAVLAVPVSMSVSLPVAHAVPPADLEAERAKAEAFRASMEAKGQLDRESLAGAVIYRERCMACHEGKVPKAPHKTFVSLMSTDSIYHALADGIMQSQSAGLSLAQK